MKSRMFWNINTIGKRLFLAFSILALNVVLISALSFHFISRNKSIHELTNRIENGHIQIMLLLKLDLDFLRFETINQDFYQSLHSDVLLQRDSLYDHILRETIALQSSLRDHPLAAHNPFDSIANTLQTYNATFNRIREKIIYRGFKDYGLEGRMRKFAHELERHSEAVSMANILSLRRHEKDFFLRKEEQYRDLFNEQADQLIKEVSNQKQTNTFVIHLLRSYKNNFNQLSRIDEEIGLEPTMGLMGKLNTLSNDISRQLTRLVKISDESAEAIIQQSLISYIIVGIVAIVISFVFTYVTALRLTRPIKKLSHTIGKYIINQGLDEADLNDTTVTNEISNLSSAFIKLNRKLRAQFQEIRKKTQLLEKRNRELQTLNEELDRFIYSSAHDLKSPLASMAGLVHLAQREINDPIHDHYFEKMRTSIDKMEGFIKDITDYAKNKRQLIKADKVDLNTIVSDIFQSFQFIPHAERIDKAVEISGGEFYTDKTRLEIILKNLISNAIRYADFGKASPFIHINATFLPTQTTIRISDNGIGIDEEHLYKIFDMFYRAHHHAKGSGIGLFLVRESVKMLRGTITVESEPQKGTTFILNLPNLKQVNVNQLPESEPIKFLTAS